MEQSELRQWEHKCIQEEAPECTASCPLHLDARLFVKEMGRGDRQAAYKVLAKAMPFPGILGRICDHPCELRCKRGEVEAPIAIGLLERTCVESTTRTGRIPLLPRRTERIAVLGGGLAGLSAAWDLLRKGFRVTLFEAREQLGGALLDYPANVLPRTVVEEELALLETLKGEVRLGETVDQERFEALCNEFDALFIDRETVATSALSLAQDAEGAIAVDPATGATEREGVFAGGSCRTYSPVGATYAGRKGALSIERFLQKAQMDAGRENEGPYQTRLFTNVEGIEPVPRVEPADSVGRYSDEEASEEAGRCIQCECMECVKVCLYLERYGAYPKKYARQVFNNERIIFGAARSKNQFINSCSNCGLCETVCPNDFHMGDLCLQSRRNMVEKKLMPTSFHEFALRDLAHSRSEAFALGRHQAGHSESAWLYFPSCQLCATAPGEVLASYDFLQEKLAGGVGILLGCCGAPAFWAGREELFRDNLAQLRRQWQELGKPRLITGCVTCQSIFTDHLPEIETAPLWPLLEGTGLPAEALRAQAATKVAIADPCMSRHLPEVQQSVRRIAEALGMEPDELALSDAKPECCGYGGLMYNANPKLAGEVIEHRLREIPPEGTKPFTQPQGWQRGRLQEGRDTAYYHSEIKDVDYLAYCAMCRDNLAAGGKRVSHLLEHLFPNVADADPAARGWISWSERRDNRVRVKTAVLRRLGEEAPPREETMQLEMSDEVRRRIDARRILEEDLRQTIAAAEASGRRLVHEKGFYRACHQPGNVTFWVDYQPTETGYRVYNAFSHRMRIVGVKS